MDAWQFTSTGTVSGISGNCDMNFFFKSFSKLLSKSTVTNAATLTYTGQVRVPSVKVDYKGTKLVRDTDFIVTAPSSRYVGSYTGHVLGINAYSSSKAFTYTIKPVKPAAKKILPRSKGFKVYWTPNTAQTSGYTVRYSTSKSFKSYSQVKVKGKSTASVKIGKLKPAKKYYVKVRAYKVVNGVTYYSSWSAVQTVKTGK